LLIVYVFSEKKYNFGIIEVYFLDYLNKIYPFFYQVEFSSKQLELKFIF